MKKIAIIVGVLVVLGLGYMYYSSTSYDYRYSGSGLASSTAATSTLYTLTDVAAHASATNCWTVVDGKVYDVTSFIPQHPGGAAKAAKMCGKDGSSLFMKQHGGQEDPMEALSHFVIGQLKK
ncbi:MAG: hypothetical protein RL094_719 [Candidatus Parcubacteria bacterium]|jgi:cytochrome b involved in lipid metabolism